MKKKIERNESRVKNLAAFAAQNMDAMRAAYQADVAALLVELMPRIARGDFTNLGDGSTYAKIGAPTPPPIQPDGWRVLRDGRREIDPGICLLESAVAAWPICTDFPLLVLACSPHAYRGKYFFEAADGGTAPERLAVLCLAQDVRDAFRRQRSAARRKAA